MLHVIEHLKSKLFQHDATFFIFVFKLTQPPNFPDDAYPPAPHRAIYATVSSIFNFFSKNSDFIRFDFCNVKYFQVPPEIFERTSTILVDVPDVFVLQKISNKQILNLHSMKYKVLAC